MRLPLYAVDSCSESSSSGLTDSTSSDGNLLFAWSPAASARPSTRDLVHEQRFASESSDEDTDQGRRRSEAAPGTEADGLRADESLSKLLRSRAARRRELRMAAQRRQERAAAQAAGSGAAEQAQVWQSISGSSAQSAQTQVHLCYKLSL